MKSVRMTAVAIGALLFALLSTATLSAASATDGAVRDALRSGNPDWYDPARDTWKRIDLAPEPAAKPSEKIPEQGSATATRDAKPKDDTASQPSASIALPATPFAWLMLLIIAGCLAALVVLLLRMRSDQIVAPAPVVRTARPVDLAALPFAVSGEERDPERALAAAIAAGNWRAAVVWIYALQLLHLDRVGAIRLRVGSTNRRYLRELRSWTDDAAGRSPCSHAVLATTIAVFERIWFGHGEADRELVESLRAAQRELVAAVPADAADRAAA